MYASTGRETQTLADQLLGDLCFLDDRDQEYEHALGQVRSFGKLGVAGWFEAMFGSARCQARGCVGLRRDLPPAGIPARWRSDRP